jgi:hypothetical protein
MTTTCILACDKRKNGKAIDTFQNLLMCLDDSDLIHIRGAARRYETRAESTKEYLHAAIDELSIRMQVGTYNKLKRLCEVIRSRSQLICR